MGSFSAVVLAAGQGKRTGLPYPKVLHPLCGKPMLVWVLEAIANLRPQSLVTVIPSQAKNELVKLLKGRSLLAVQEKPLGTGDALQVGIAKIKRKTGSLLTACGDTPLLSSGTLRELLDFHESHRGAATILTDELPDPTGYGRIVRNAHNEVEKILEDKDAPSSIKEIREINTGTYVFELDKILDAFPGLRRDNVQREYYLTDCIGRLVEQGQKVFSMTVRDPTSALGVNTLKELSEAARLLNDRLKEKWLNSGVVFTDPETVYLDADITIGQGTTLYPYTFIESGSRIGSNCQIGPFVKIRSSKLGNEVTIQNAFMLDSEAGHRCSIGPFAYLRPGTRLESGVKVGDFVEIKNSTIGQNSKVPHLSYVGDAVLGKEVNIGAGTITCNYDGTGKHRTIIENGAFIGSNTNLVAPVRVGKYAVTGAGSVVTKNVKAKTVVAGVPATTLNKGRKRHGG